MKLRIYIIIIIVVCLFSCGRRDNSVYNPSLLSLENSLEIMPEKTLREILDIDTASFKEADKALYYFLLFKAKVLSSDSIQIPIDKSNLSLAHFTEDVILYAYAYYTIIWEGYISIIMLFYGPIVAIIRLKSSWEKKFGRFSTSR